MNALPEPGTILAERTIRFTRADLVAYADASGDQNQIHQDDAVAAAMGLPGVIAHGMLTMGAAVQPVVDWIAGLEPGPDGARARIRDYGVRFTRMVVVDAADGAEVQVVAKVAQVDEAARTLRVDLTVSVEGQTVLGKAQVGVALP